MIRTGTPLVASPHVSSFLGFDSLFDRLDRMFETPVAAGYPPMNVYKEDEGDYVIEVALAGFKKENVSIEHDKRRGILSIVGDNTPKTEPVEAIESDSETRKSSKRSTGTKLLNAGQEAKEVSTNRVMLKQGIASRRFEKAFTIADDLEVADASLADGMLTIRLKKIDSPESQPLRIELK